MNGHYFVPHQSGGGNTMHHDTEHECDDCGWVFECWTFPCKRPFTCDSCREINRRYETEDDDKG